MTTTSGDGEQEIAMTQEETVTVCGEETEGTAKPEASVAGDVADPAGPEASVAGDVAAPEATKAGDATDPYSYVNREGFTSEIYKIEVKNLPKRFGVGEFKKKLASLGLKPNKVKAVDRGHFAYVNFRSEEERQEGLHVLQGHTWRGKQLKVKNASPAADPLMKRRLQQESEEQSGSKRIKTMGEDDDLSPTDRLNKAVTPLLDMPYEEQLQKKQKTSSSFLQRLGREIETNNYSMKSWLSEQRKANGGVCCCLLPILPSPVCSNYRNKCEFTIGTSPEGKDKTVGFRLGAYCRGSVSVVEPQHCVHVADAARMAVKELQEYLQRVSSYAGFTPQTKAGHWQQATIRNNAQGQVLAILHFYPQKLSKEELDAEKDQLQTYFTMDQSEHHLTSLYFLPQGDKSKDGEEATCEHVLGEKFIHEQLLDLKFRISPSAFFQVNTSAAEVLYSTVGDWCAPQPGTVLLDVCCGTGTIGLTMATRVQKVVGIELCQEAVDDAKVNAELNDITNAEFHCGKAETVLPSLIRRFYGMNVVAVVDPPRGGLHGDVVRAIRKSSFVKRLVYVSCNPPGALANLIDLTRAESKRVKGKEFRLLKAVTVDLFPHTDHCEMVFLFSREDHLDSQVSQQGSDGADTRPNDTDSPPKDGDSQLQDGDCRPQDGDSQPVDCDSQLQDGACQPGDGDSRPQDDGDDQPPKDGDSQPQDTD